MTVILKWIMWPLLIFFAMMVGKMIKMLVAPSVDLMKEVLNFGLASADKISLFYHSLKHLEVLGGERRDKVYEKTVQNNRKNRTDRMV